MENGVNACPVKNISRNIEYISPDRPSRCTWKAGADTKNSPHTQKPLTPRPKIIPNILHAIGNTPLVKLNKIPQMYGIKCDMYAKCEFLNPGGSVKDRIGFRMVEEAERKGLLKPGDVIIEPTSGNTGIGLAMACAIKGYRCLIVMSEKMSNEKVDTLKALGAEIIRTPIEAGFDHPDGLMLVAHRLNNEIPNSIILNQYRNAGNPLAHYDGTAAEIIDAFDGKLDMVVIGAGTGGTVAGIGRKFKELCPTCTVVGGDPEGSILAQPAELNETNVDFYEVEGIGYDFIPTVLDRSVVDKWVKSNDSEALPMARRLIKEEGLLGGGSCGTAMMVALKAAKDLKAGQKCVVILPDGIRNYMTKFISDGWMVARDLIEVEDKDHWWWKLHASNIHLETPQTYLPSMTCREAVKVMKNKGLSYLMIADADGFFKGVVTSIYLTTKLNNKRLKFDDTIEKAIVKQICKASKTATLGKVSCMLEKEPYVMIVHEKSGNEVLDGVITNMDLMSFVSDAKY